MSERLRTYHVLSAEDVESARAYFATCDDRWVGNLGLGLCASHETLRTQLAAREARIKSLESLAMEALDAATEHAPYVPECLREKWHVMEDLKRMREEAVALDLGDPANV